jgi:hypothetical protein
MFSGRYLYLTVGGTSGANDIGAGLSCELRHLEPTAPAAPLARTLSAA